MSQRRKHFENSLSLPNLLKSKSEDEDYDVNFPIYTHVGVSSLYNLFYPPTVSFVIKMYNERGYKTTTLFRNDRSSKTKNVAFSRSVYLFIIMLSISSPATLQESITIFSCNQFIFETNRKA